MRDIQMLSINMKTILDKGYSWFLEKIEYEGSLHILLVEAGLGAPSNLDLGDVVLEKTRPIEVGDASKRVKLDFEGTIAWQCLDESYSAFDEYEIRDEDGKLQVISQSRYLDYVNDCHGWYKDIHDKSAMHYRIWTEDEVIDVVALDPPAIEQINA